MIRLAPAIVIGAMGLSVLCGCDKVWQYVEIQTSAENTRVVGIPPKQDLVEAIWNITPTNSEVILRFAVKEER